MIGNFQPNDQIMVALNSMTTIEVAEQLHYFNGILLQIQREKRVGDLNFLLRLRASDYIKLNNTVTGFHREDDVQVIITHDEATTRLTLMADSGATASFEKRNFTVESIDGPYDLRTATRWLEWFSKIEERR